MKIKKGDILVNNDGEKRKDSGATPHHNLNQ